MTQTLTRDAWFRSRSPAIVTPDQEPSRVQARAELPIGQR
jgi:hypothetical protein